MNPLSLQQDLNARVLVADGATGTYLERLMGDLGHVRRDRLPLDEPEAVRRIHRDYLSAGADIIKTATFSASVLGLGLDPGKRESGELAFLLNEAAASIAKGEALAAMARGGRLRWVAGSVGPGPSAPSLGGAAYRELKASYLPQMEGLVAGGADLVLIETVQDTLQAKAAIAALREAGRRRGRTLPFIVSATLAETGRMLCGASPEAFAAIIEPFGPLAIGLNCSGGAEDLADSFAALAGFASSPLCLMPNAGKPRRVGGAIVWPSGPEEFAGACIEAISAAGGAIVGGCCGTGPEHVAALRRRADALGPPRLPREPAFSLASNYEAVPLREGRLFVVDERGNASGSAAFRKLLAEDDLEEAARFIERRAEGRADAADICVAGGGRDEAAFLSGIVGRVAASAGSALSLDSLDAVALAAALPLIAGRPLINSVNLENTEAADAVLDLAVEFGAAVVCLAVDERGPARTVADKLSVCGRLYDRAVSRGLRPVDLLFDVCTFPAAAGGAATAGSAARTFAAVAGLQGSCPGSAAILGVGNSSFGLPRGLRPSFTAAFLRQAVASGLRAAIVDSSVAVAVESGAADDIEMAASPFLSDGQPDDGDLDRLLACAGPAAGSSPAEEREEGAEDLAERGGLRQMTLAIFEGSSRRAMQSLAMALYEGLDRDAVAGSIAGAMAELGKRYDAGRLALPLVLRSADAARACFDALRSASLPDAGSAEPRGRALVVLSTVRGDLHDIGKNLVGMVLESAGYAVADMGVDRTAQEIVAEASRLGAAAIGVSGLLTRSLAEMERIAQELAAGSCAASLLCGGAAVDGDFVAGRLEPLLPGRVHYGKDPFAALEILGALAAPAGGRADGATPAPPRLTPEIGPNPGERVAGPKEGFVTETYPLDLLLEGLNRATLGNARLGFGRDKAAEAAALIERGIRSLRGGVRIEARCRRGWFRVAKKGGERLEFLDERSGVRVEFAFPREPSGLRRSVVDYYDESEIAAAFCVTLGAAASEALKAVRAAGTSEDYLVRHGILAGLAESAADLAHRRIAAELSARGAQSPGKRYSFGFAGCPGTEANGPLLELLSAADIGVDISETFQLIPEFTVTAIVVARNDAQYFAVRAGQSG